MQRGIRSGGRLTTYLEDICFDGDETNIKAVLDGYSAASLEHFNAAGTALSLSDPDQVSGDINLPKEIWSMVANWAEEGIDGC